MRNDLPPEERVGPGFVWVIGAIGLALGVVAIAGSTVGILTASRLNDAIHNYKIQRYADDVRNWHERVAGCTKSRTAIRGNTLEGIADAKAISDPRHGSSSVAIRHYYENKIPKLRRRLLLVDPRACETDYPRPTTPVGVKHLP